jgi:hypothetical protein
MKRYFFVGIFVLYANNVFAIESGTYRCQTAFGPVDVVLKGSGRAIAGHTRGFWKNYGDEALVVNNNWILEDKSKGIFTFRGAKCKKIK